MPLFQAPLNLNGYEIQNANLQSLGGISAMPNVAARIAYDSVTGRPIWSDGTNRHYIYPAAIPGTRDGFPLTTGSGTILTVNTFVGNLTGVSTNTLRLGRVGEPGFGIDIGGKARADTIFVDDAGSSGSLVVTDVDVLPDDIRLADGNFLVGTAVAHWNGGTKAASVAKSAIPLSGFGNPTADVNFGSKRITNLLGPSASTDGANKQYVDDAVAGRVPKTPARVATTTALPAWTSSGSPTILTASANGALVIDGVTLAVGNRVLVKNETSSAWANGIRVVSNAGSAGSAWVLARATDADTSGEISPGDEYFVVEGTLNAGSNWALATPSPITLDTTSLTFVQTGASAAYTAGNGIVIVGNAIHFAQSTVYPQYAVGYATSTTTTGFTAAPTSDQVLVCPSIGGAPVFGQVNLTSGNAVTGTLPAVRGGTGQASYTVGDILYASGATALSKLAGVATGNVLLSGGVGVAPAWGKVAMDAAVTGILPVSNGGTGVSSITNKGIVVGSGTAAITTITGTSAQIVQANASGVPGFVSVAGDFTIANGGVASITAKAVTFPKIRDVGANVVLGNITGGGMVAEITLAALATALAINPTITLTGAIGGSGAGTIVTNINALQVQTGHIDNLAVTESKLGANSVTTLKVLNNNITFGKIEQGAALSVIGVAGTSTANVAAIAAGVGSANKILRVDNAGNVLGFGAIQLASTNAVTGQLLVSNGGTGTATASVFPTVIGHIGTMRRRTLSSGTNVYSATNPFGNTSVIARLYNSSGQEVYADIVVTAGNIVVTFGSATVSNHTLVITGNDTLSVDTF